MRHARIVSTGRAVAPKLLTNQWFDEQLKANVSDWLVEKVGIRQRYVMEEGQTTSDLATTAGLQALERARLKPTDLDLIIVATDTPDFPSPATASVVQHKLKATRAGTFDLNCACAGWVTALDTGSKFIIADEGYRHVLVIGAYGMSRHLDWTDKHTCTLFADGAGAVVLSASTQPGLIASTLFADGIYNDALGIYQGGTAAPSRPGTPAPAVKFVRKFPATYNLEHWPRLVRTVADAARVKLEDIKLFVFTQLNLQTIHAVMAELDQPISRAHWVMDKWGYTGSACIPMTLDDAVEANKLQPGDLVAFCASGGGVAMAASIFKWNPGDA
jgi:3-oxoacyl-[acyl-carrier-protein] synthase-3